MQKKQNPIHAYQQVEQQGEDLAEVEQPLFATAHTDEEEFQEDPRQDENLAKLEELQKMMDDFRLRQAAEMENFKKRLSRDHEEQNRYAAGKVLGDLLPVLDNLELALQYGTQNEVCKDLLQGVAMTHKMLLEAVCKHGLQPVGAVGEEFNPALHEAVGFAQDANLQAGLVAKVLQRGYTFGERLLRPAKVMISQ